MEYFHPEKLLTLKLLLSWWPQPFQMGPGKMEYLILWQNLQILSFTKKTYEKIVNWSRKWQPEKYKIVQSKKHIYIKKNFFPTGRVYSKKQNWVTANQHIFKSGLNRSFNIFLAISNVGNVHKSVDWFLYDGNIELKRAKAVVCMCSV